MIHSHIQTITRHVSLTNRVKREDPSSQVRKPLSYNDATNKKNLHNLLPVIFRLWRVTSLFHFSFLLFLLRGLVWSPFAAGAGSDSSSSTGTERFACLRLPAPLRTWAWLVFNGDRTVSTGSTACETTTQIPGPETVVIDARQRFWFVPPVHLVPAGSLMMNCCVSSFAGAIWAATKPFPVPDASTWMVSTSREPGPSAPLKVLQIQPTCSPAYGNGLCTHGLTLTEESKKAPVSSTVTLVEVSRSCAMFTLVQGSAMEGRWTSPLVGVSLRWRKGGFEGAIVA